MPWRLDDNALTSALLLSVGGRPGMSEPLTDAWLFPNTLATLVAS